jgi:hypothetical protein
MHDSGPSSRNRNHTIKRVVHCILVILALAAIAAFLFPVFARIPVARQRAEAFADTLARQEAPWEAGREASIVYFSWFPTGDPRHADECILMSNGR